jgi:uncharacterized protein (DUF2336 family)
MLIERFVGWMETAPSDKRAKATNALARAWLISPLGSDEREAAEATLTFLLDDPDPQVRLAIATALCAAHDAPRHIILSLAQDAETIAIPVLAASPVFLDAELVSIVSEGNDEYQVAIACRPAVGPDVCAAIAEHGCESACLALVLNPGARPSAEDFLMVAHRFGEDEELRRAMLDRHDIGMRARLHLIEKYALALIGECPPEAGPKQQQKREKEMREVCDKAAITYAAQVSQEGIFEIVDALISEKRLTTALLLRALCMGNISLFATALSRLSGQPLARVERVLIDNRHAAFEAIYTKAGLPVSARPVFATAVSCWRSALDRLGDTDHARLPYMVTREVLVVHRPGTGSVNEDLLMLLGRICAETARDHARSHVRQLALGYACKEQERMQLQNMAVIDHAANANSQDQVAGAGTARLSGEDPVAATAEHTEPAVANAVDEPADEVLEVEADTESGDEAAVPESAHADGAGVVEVALEADLSDEDFAIFAAAFEKEIALMTEEDAQTLDVAEVKAGLEVANREEPPVEDEIPPVVVDLPRNLEFQPHERAA